MQPPTFADEHEKAAYDALMAKVLNLGQEPHWRNHSRWSQLLACQNLIRNAEKIVPILNRLIAARRRSARRAIARND